MQKRQSSHLLSFLCASAIVLPVFSAVVRAENSVHIECPVYVSEGSSDSIGIRVFVANDSALHVYTLGFWLYTDEFVFTSATPGPAIMYPSQNGQILAHVFPPGNQITFAWFKILPEMPYPPHPEPAHAFTLWIRSTSSYNGGCADLDSGYVQHDCYWRFMVHGSYRIISPDYYDCDTCDITGEVFSCGDFDASGQNDIADVVYLVNYIFAGGPAPHDDRIGDVDCSQQTNIADAVYLVNYIFVGGPGPCAACP